MKNKIRYIEINALSDDTWYIYESYEMIDILNDEKKLYPLIGNVPGRFIFAGVFEVDSDYSIIEDDEKLECVAIYLITDKQEKFDVFDKIMKYKLIE